MPQITRDNRNMLVPWYLMAAYVYYYLDDQLVTDAEFDDMSRRLLEDYDTIKHHHKHLITKEDLEAGTLLLSEDEYPSIVKGAAIDLLTLKQERKTTRRRAGKTK